MAGAPLHLLVLLCVTLVAVAEVVVHEEDLSRDQVPGVEAHSWTVLGGGQDDPSNFVMRVNTFSANGRTGAQSLADMFADELQKMGYGSQSAAFDSGFRSGDAFGWVNEQLDHFENLPFWVSTSVQSAMQLPTEDSQGQMLHNVACARFEPALVALRSQNSNNLVWGESDSDDKGWDIEVTFVPYDGEADNADIDQIDWETGANWALSKNEVADKPFLGDIEVEGTASTDHTEHWLTRCLFFMLLFACILTFFVCLKQTCELRRAMKETAHIASEIAFYEEVEEKKPLLQKKGIEESKDEYTDILIQPIAEPALKAVYP